MGDLLLLLLPTDREACIWDLEERQQQEKHQLIKQQLKEQYFLQRHELLRKHEKVKALGSEKCPGVPGGSLSRLKEGRVGWG